MEECPVYTKLYVDRETEFVARHLGRRYRFCSDDHRTQFEQAPGEYV